MISTLMIILNYLGKNSKLCFGIIGLVIVISAYMLGRDHGFDSCKQEWDAYVAKNEKLNNELKEQYQKDRAKLLKDNYALSQEILNNEKQYQINVINLERDYVKRLSESEQRADYYQSVSSKANRGGCSSSILANHTARLDRALTEGINLVKRLRELIELRDSQLKQCGTQVKLLIKENQDATDRLGK